MQLGVMDLPDFAIDDSGLISPAMHSECKRVRTDPMSIICYSQRHSIRPGWDTSVFGH